MNEESFIRYMEQHNLHLKDEQISQFRLYYEQLVEWNEKVNLTAITKKEDVFEKHFFDSISLSFFHSFENKETTLCDVGAGAGFPSIPLKVCFPQLKITIIDSLKKRITFLEHLVEHLHLTDVNLLHGRAEDFGQQKNHRESYDIVTARAVAKMNVLAEFCLPLVKKGGLFIAMKGPQITKEMEEAQKAIQRFGGELKREEKFALPIENSERSIVFISKNKNTPKKYPRKPGIPSKNPIVS